ncbi:hypothetical protein L484_012925 [Morus notabilis]|uniref:Uncharacterized protein n=1 Tax=Morus notabilis TaxID=981085 RepID=W9QRK9_9ROSA|nr:hypothetical protein L484_012925 [Morus notabilis]
MYGSIYRPTTSEIAPGNFFSVGIGRYRSVSSTCRLFVHPYAVVQKPDSGVFPSKLNLSK